MIIIKQYRFVYAHGRPNEICQQPVRGQGKKFSLLDLSKRSSNHNMSKENHIKPYFHHAKYYETDQMGIVHHSNYIRWMEEARIEVMRQFGISYRSLEENGVISPVVSVSCQYKGMVHFDDTVAIQVKVAKYNGVRLDLEYEMTDSKTGELRTTGTSTSCFLNRDGHVISLRHGYPEIDKCFRNMKE